MLDTFITFVKLMFLKDFPEKDFPAKEYPFAAASDEYVRKFAEDLIGSGYTLAQLNDDHELFWKLDDRFRAYSHPRPF